MGKRTIVFTRKIEKKLLKELSKDEFEITTHDFIKVNFKEAKEIKPLLNEEVNDFFVSSKKIIPYVKELKIDGNFYVVGNKTANELKKLGKNVVLSADNASELTSSVNGHVNKFHFLCSSIRRDEIPDWAKNKNIECLEINCYDTKPDGIQVEGVPDALVFFSPSAVKSYLEINQIDSRSILFVIGMSTLMSLPAELPNTIVISQDPSYESVIHSINKYFLNAT